VSTDQIPGGSVFKFYRRQGGAGGPHDHAEVVFEIRTTADATDGIEVVSRDLPGFPDGILVAMNSASKNFALFPWASICAAAGPTGCR
jgi:hypothetical protein